MLKCHFCFEVVLVSMFVAFVAFVFPFVFVCNTVLQESKNWWDTLMRTTWCGCGHKIIDVGLVRVLQQ